MAELIGLDHRLREPDGEPAGALVLNHGRGADENDLFGLIDELDADRRLLGVTTGAPFGGIPPGGRHWYAVERVGYPAPEMFATSYELLTGFVDGLLAERGLDHSALVVGGFSMGAVMSHAIGAGAGRPAPAGVIALSGFVPRVEGWRLREVLAGLPVFIHHGANDPIIDAGFGRDARDRLDAAGADVTYVETDAGHWLPPEILPSLRDFVASALAADRAPAGEGAG